MCVFGFIISNNNYQTKSAFTVGSFQLQTFVGIDSIEQCTDENMAVRDKDTWSHLKPNFKTVLS